jgi:hypothetical protein
MKTRAEEMKASLKIESELGQRDEYRAKMESMKNVRVTILKTTATFAKDCFN